MSLDFQSIREQVKLLGENAHVRAQQLQNKRERAFELLANNAQNVADLRQKVETVVRNHDPFLRCALPVIEPLNASFPLPMIPDEMSVLAADGSQITPDRHAEVNFAVINVGTIQLRRGSSEPPETTITSQLLYEEQLYSTTGTITDAKLAQMRDLNERLILAKLAELVQPPVVTLTDGPMELWGGKSGDSTERADFQESLKHYLEALSQIHDLSVITAGYVDKPSANLVVRTLEVAMTQQTDLSEIKNHRPLRGVTDIVLYRDILDPGGRSPVFALQSQSAKSYQGPLALHFFYLNVGQHGRPYLARVEIPAWVADNPDNLDILHGTLIDQCRVMGVRPYPYLLHRAHETAVVKFQEKEQVTLMIAQELRERGLTVGELSFKQSAKQATGRARYER